MRILAAIALILLVSIRVGLAAQITFGDCAPIVNLNFGNPEAVKKFIQENYAVAEGDGIQIVVDFAVCGKSVEDPDKRLRMLVFALDQMLIMKTQWYIPALDHYLRDPSPANFQSMVSLGQRNLKRIEKAIDSLVDYEATLQQNHGNASQHLQAQDAQLQFLADSLAEKLSVRLQQPLSLNQILNQSQSRSQALSAMIEYRNRYVKIVDDISQIVAEMKRTLKQ